MPLVSEYSRKKKIDFFLPLVPTDARVLEVGSGDGWLGDHMKRHGWSRHTGVDLREGADVVGDIRNWRALGLKPESFDVIIAFELVEHVPAFQEFFDLLVPGGLLMLTSPVPHMDWACWLLERLGLNQRRTSPHNHLIYFGRVPFFEPVQLRTIGFMAQWGIFRKPGSSQMLP